MQKRCTSGRLSGNFQKFFRRVEKFPDSGGNPGTGGKTFACLPNHVVGKGVIKTLKKAYPQADIAAVDYAPGASEVNQLNRIRLMQSAAKENEKNTVMQQGVLLRLCRELPRG